MSKKILLYSLGTAAFCTVLTVLISVIKFHTWSSTGYKAIAVFVPTFLLGLIFYYIWFRIRKKLREDKNVRTKS